ncbi:hypothetical protein As57867_017823, partial [Aphanomyces stellatus]
MAKTRVTADDVVGVDGFLHASHFDPTKCLRTRDGLTKSRTSFAATGTSSATTSPPPSLPLAITASDVRVSQAHRLELVVLEHVLTADECATVMAQAKRMTYSSLEHSYTGTKRQGERLLTLDQPMADLLWDRLHTPLASVLDSHGATTTPLGFGVGNSEWSLAGINPAMRVNAHRSTSSFFGPHVDAQRVASGHERALFSVVVYLNEDEFEAGETAFH